jgi:hypothetical protein
MAVAPFSSRITSLSRSYHITTTVVLGVVYHLTFFHQSAVALRADVKPDGCHGASFNGATLWTTWVATSPQFWALLAETLDVPPSAVYPVIPQPAGSFVAPAVL